MQAGKISHQMAQELSEKELAKYEEQLRLVEATEPFSDFDKLVVEKLKELSPSRKEILPRSESKAQAVSRYSKAFAARIASGRGHCGGAS